MSSFVGKRDRLISLNSRWGSETFSGLSAIEILRTALGDSQKYEI